MQHGAQQAPVLDSGTASLRRTIESKQGASSGSASGQASSFEEFYEIADTANFIVANKAKRVALQFPDTLLSDSLRVTVALQARVGSACKLFVLADTSYGSCCVDEVAAQHAAVDLMIHFGDACLSPTRRFPVRYVFGHGNLDVAAVAASLSNPAAIMKHFADAGSKGPRSIVVFYELQYEHAVAALSAKLASMKSALPCPVVLARVSKEVAPLKPAPTSATQTAAGSQCSCSGSCTGKGCSTATGSACCDSGNPESKRSAGPAASAGDAKAAGVAAAAPAATGAQSTVGGFSFPELSSEAAAESAFVYIGRECPALTNIILNFARTPMFTCDPRSGALRREEARVNRTLARRYYLMEKAKNAAIVGIVVGTLGVANYLDVIAHIKRQVVAAGKKWYMFLVGKLNEPKLSNFSEIDIFVLVACPINIMFDSTGYFKDVVTPFELQIALTRGAQWSGDYSTDFSQVLPGGRFDQKTLSSGAGAAGADDGEGGLRYSAVSRSLQADSDASGESKELVATGGSGTALTVVTARDRMLQRTFKGLDVTFNNSEPARIEMGLSGIARHYASEDSLMQRKPAAAATSAALADSLSEGSKGSAAAGAAAESAGAGAVAGSRRVKRAAATPGTGAGASSGAAKVSVALESDEVVAREEDGPGRAEGDTGAGDWADFL